jgi:hypothetical protein
MRLIVTLIALLLLLTACADQGDPAKAVEDYLKAKVSSDADKMTELSCKDWEDDIPQEAASFESVKAEVQDMSCKKGDKDGNYTLVTCEGKIVVEYDGETRDFPLSATAYRTLEEDGEWKMCGTQ